MEALSVLHADEHLIALDKPAGQLVIPGRGARERTLLDDAQEAYGRLWVVHRLDRGTSGVVLFPRTAQAHRVLNLAFDRREILKRYLALVRGWPPREARIDVPIAPARRGRMRPGRRADPRAKQSATLVRSLSAYAARPPLPRMALVEIVPETGRTHQIRIHLAWAGTPLVIDPDYGERAPLLDAAGAVLLDRTPLHAVSLGLAHPVTHASLRIEAPLPGDMARTIAAAEGGAAGPIAPPG
jgi:tRNA pseudouridine32 synthase/23S rRNA pseudouridine746 synthase